MAYDVSDHPLLDLKATQLYAKSSDLFVEYEALAVQQLGLKSDTSYTDTQLLSLRRAIALQINWMLMVPASAAWVKQESSAHSKQNVTYRDGIPVVDPRAAAIVAEVIPIDEVADRWSSITSVRRAVR